MDIGQRCVPPLQQAEGITVASVFNGIGCPLVALDQLNIPVKKLYLQDWDDYAARVCAHHYPNADVTTLPKNAEHIQEHHIQAMGPTDLLIITPPCTDFSGLKKGPPDMRQGLAGKTGKLMLDSINIVRWYLKHNPAGQFILENVVFNDMPDWQHVCDALGTPHVMNANVYSYTHRRRAFWTNIAVPDKWEAPMHEPLHPNEVLNGRRLMLNHRASTITASWKDTPQGTIKEHTRCPIKIWDPEATDVPYHQMTPDHPEAQFLQPTEGERLIGLPPAYTDVQPCSPKDRMHAIGNGIDVRTIKHLLQHARWLPTTPEEAATRAAGLTPCAPLSTITEALKKPLTLNAEAMAAWLTPGPCPAGWGAAEWNDAAAHPTVQKDIQEWATGADLRFEGDRDQQVLAPNSTSCLEAPQETAAVICKELEAGRMLGPFAIVPMEGFRVVPRAMKDEMLRSGKWRPISLNNLPVGNAVNEGISPAEDPICLPTHAAIRHRIARAHQRCGRVVLAKRDIRLAYRLHQVRPLDWNLCGVQWDGQLYIDTHLSFGCRSSVDRFLTISDAIEWALRRWGVTAIHYIDDFIFVAESDEEAAVAVQKFETICAAWNIPIKQEKDVGPGTNVELLGVVYDTVNMTATMPQGTLERLQQACSIGLETGMTTKAAASLVGLMTWASSCMPQASAFVTALRYAETKARMENLRFVHLTARIKADLRWWQRAADLTSCRNASILQTKVTAARVLHGDAGTEWGLGGYDGTTFYKAKHTPDILRAAMRHKRHSSKFLELFNVLVMARIYSADWTGQHVSISVDNHALPRACERLTSRSRTECAMLHEIAMLQIRDGWTWEVTWIPRELNDAADALSKNDMQRFYAAGHRGCSERHVPNSAMRVPSVDMDETPYVLPSGKGRGVTTASRPPVVLFRPPAERLTQHTLESHLEAQLQHIMTSMSDESSKQGVKSYLAFADQCGWSAERILPPWDAMQHNVMLYMLNAVQTYNYVGRDGHTTTKKAISAGSLGTYLSHINGWYAKVTDQPRGVTTTGTPPALLRELRKALPKSNCQKAGITIEMLRSLIHSAKQTSQPLMWQALFALAWYGVLRPCECVPKAANAFNAARHPTRANITFYAHDKIVHPTAGATHKPTHMVFTVKQSKTDQERLTQDVVIGANGDIACAVSAMWRYMISTQNELPSAPLFTAHGATVTYSHMLHAVKQHSKAAGHNPHHYGGHSFRIGGSQALAAAGRSITYIMSYGRWRCTESVLRYVKTPLYIRMLDAQYMASSTTQMKWDNIQEQVQGYYAHTHLQQQLWDSTLMIHPGITPAAPSA